MKERESRERRVKGVVVEVEGERLAEVEVGIKEGKGVGVKIGGEVEGRLQRRNFSGIFSS